MGTAPLPQGISLLLLLGVFSLKQVYATDGFCSDANIAVEEVDIENITSMAGGETFCARVISR